jgi:Kef-type K+ transport system membrane component KefB
MRKSRNAIFYILTIGIFSALMYWISIKGQSLEKGRNIHSSEGHTSQWAEFVDSMSHNLNHPLAILLAQIVTIILVARIFGWMSKKVGQPTVIGEIIAGIVLGPSLLGWIFPDLSLALFPLESLGNLQFLSQIGLILFMFVIGMELDLKVLRNKANDAVVISHASIVIPFTLGIGLAYFIYTSFAPEGVEFLSFGLFLGIAMSITAFPVLARIVQERGLQKTRLGTVVITCAAADDITAWCLLAAVIAIVKAGSFVSSLYVIGLAIGYVFLMIKVIRPFLKRIGDLHTSRENLSKPIVAIFFFTLILSAFATEVIGIHALFGAFMAGAIMPENTKFRNIFIEKVEDVSLVLLLPLFFVYTGLRTEVGLLNDAYLWKVTAMIILVAVVGKFVGSAIAARFVGQNWKDSLIIGALMNTRGLMELVVLNIGYDLGVLTPEIFAMMVIMALVTTLMTGPALDLINWAFRSKPFLIPEEIIQQSNYRVLVSFGHPERGRSLLRLAHSMIRKLNGSASITAMHLSPVDELNYFNQTTYERESFAPVIHEAQQLQQKVTTLFKASSDIEGDIIEMANKGDYDLLLMGVGQSIFEGSLLGKILGFTTKIISPDRILNQVTGKENLFENLPFDERTRTIIRTCQVPVGVWIDKGFNQADRIFMPIFSQKDDFLVPFAQRWINNSGAQVTLIDAAGQVKARPEIKEVIRAIEHVAPHHIQLRHENYLSKEFLKTQDLMVISFKSWKKLVESKSVWLSDIPSVLILSESKVARPSR